jgi:hypothetical protein
MLEIFTMEKNFKNKEKNNEKKQRKKTTKKTNEKFMKCLYNHVCSFITKL